jgi:anti-anti-sigma factor
MGTFPISPALPGVTMLAPTVRYLDCPVVVLKLTGSHFHTDDQVLALEDDLSQACAATEPRHIVLDFTNVRFLCSAYLIVLLKLYRKVRERGGRLVLCNVCPEVEEVFVTAHLWRTFWWMSGDVPAALASLYHGPLSRTEEG